MCGIAGLTSQNRSKLDIMLKRISHRGPDNYGVFVDENVSLGHHRLSIIDLSFLGKQPMVTKHGDSVIIYNGEIYNFLELKKDLERRRYSFNSATDTEVILYGYKEFGVDFFSKMRGMWALALYDKDKQRIILARDYFGIKPLYYACQNNVLYFASEIKGLTPVLNNLKPNTDYYYQYFNLGYFIPPNTCYQNIKKLFPGEILIWDLSRKKIKRRQAVLIDKKEKINYINSFEEAVNLVNLILLDSVKAHYVSDVPVGLLLSGGNDSSLLAAMSVAIGKKPVAYNLDIQNSVDAKYAKKVSHYLGLELVSAKMSKKLLEEQYERVWEIIDEPTADSSIIPTSLIYSFIAGRAKVVISGEGGDEMFGGYLRHLRLARLNFVRNNNPIINLFNFFTRGNSFISLKFINPASNRIRNFVLDKIQDDIIGTYLSSARKIDYPFYYNDLRDYLYNYWRQFNQEARGNNNLFFDRFLYLPNDLMYKTDMSSMAYSIESRVPFLDKFLYKTIATKIPARYQLSLFYNNKVILKKVMEKYLPSELIYRPKKGFSFSFKRYGFESFYSDYHRAAEFHLSNQDVFALTNSGLCKILNKRFNQLVINKYPGFAFALVANWKVMR